MRLATQSSDGYQTAGMVCALSECLDPIIAAESGVRERPLASGVWRAT